ncbi:MAG: beta-lactamase regulating signal transducer with metallopeptidase domain [Saprospiraceae bacterium]|jgi:beta-lactamase regulating signal transducer with metallopeptidase domain
MMNHLSIPQYLLESSFCLIIFYAFFHLILKKETHFQFNRIYLITSALFSLFIPIIHIDFSKASHITGADQVFPILSTVDAFQLGINQTITQQNNVLQISVADAVTWIYIAGFFIMALKLASGLFKLFGIINRSPKMKDIDHTLLISNDVPASSFFSYIFWQDKHDKNDKVQKTIMDHEMVHVRQWHSLDVIMMEIMVIVKWFNPLIYLFRNSLKRNHEFIADKYVSEKMMDKVTYANILLTNKATTNLPPATNHFYGHIKERIKMLSAKKSTAYSQLKYMAAIPLAMVLFSFFSFDLSDRLPENVKSPFQKIENTMLATADQNVISLNMDEEVEKENFYLTWGEFMKVVLTQKYTTQDLIFQYTRSDLNNLLSLTPSIVQNGKSLNVEIDTLEVLKNNKKMAIALEDLNTDALRKKFIDSLGINDQIMISLKSYSDTDSLRINLHLSLDKASGNQWAYQQKQLLPTEIIKWGNLKISFDEWYSGSGTRLNLDNVVTMHQIKNILNEKIELSSNDGPFQQIDPSLQISFEYKRANNLNLASVDAEAITNIRHSNNPENDVVYFTTHYNGEDYQIHENTWSFPISEFHNRKEEFATWLSNAKNGDNISVSISKPSEKQSSYRFNLRFSDDDEAISAPFPIELPHTSNFYNEYQIVMNEEGKSLVRLDLNNPNSRRIAETYKGSQSYEIVHIDGFKTKSHVYETNLPQGKLEIAEILDPELRDLDKFRINEYYSATDQLIRMDWGKMVSMPNIGNYSMKEFKRSSKGSLALFTGTENLMMDRYDLLIIPENGKIKRIRTDKVNTLAIRKILGEVESNTSIYIDNIIVNLDGERRYYPYNFVFTVE